MEENKEKTETINNRVNSQLEKKQKVWIIISKKYFKSVQIDDSLISNIAQLRPVFFLHFFFIATLIKLFLDGLEVCQLVVINLIEANAIVV